jgi:hypothetical protein
MKRVATWVASGTGLISATSTPISRFCATAQSARWAQWETLNPMGSRSNGGANSGFSEGPGGRGACGRRRRQVVGQDRPQGSAYERESPPIVHTGVTPRALASSRESTNCALLADTPRVDAELP